MTITYDPKHPVYLDEADVRHEVTRVFDLCHGCRLCVDYCASFPTLFEMIDRHDHQDDHDAGLLTPAEQDQVIDECFQCNRCAVNCPYTPALHERAVDFPRLMLRAEAMRTSTGQKRLRRRVTTQFLARSDLIGALATSIWPLRKVVAMTARASSARLVLPYARQHFSTWFRKRPKQLAPGRRGAVTVFPTCLVEYRAPDIGKDLVNVFEYNGIACSLAGAGCCGAPWLGAGDLARFTKVAEENVRALATEIRLGGDIVVPQPTCGYVLRHDYVAYVTDPRLRADAQLVADHTFDAAEYLMMLHTAEGGELDTEFAGTVPSHVTYHTACEQRSQRVGSASRDLMALTGATVRLVEQCSGMDGMWGLRLENEQMSRSMARELAERLGRIARETPAAVLAGDCVLANAAITEQTGVVPVHPLSMIARAYGIDTEGQQTCR